MGPPAPAPAPASVTLATFNIHMGIDGYGRPYDVVRACADLDADVIVLQESWAPDGSPGTAETVAGALGYAIVAQVPLARARVYEPLPTTAARWGPAVNPLRKSIRLDGERWAVPAGPADRASSPGSWGVAVLARVPFADVAVIDLGKLKRDAARRAAVRCSIETASGILWVHGTHMSHITHGSHAQYRRLSRQMPPSSVPAVLAGDMNMWGPPVTSYFPGWRRALRSRTWPAHRPHSQLDHVLVTSSVRVLDARVIPFTGSDHRPVVVRLAPV